MRIELGVVYTAVQATLSIHISQSAWAVHSLKLLQDDKGNRGDMLL